MDRQPPTPKLPYYPRFVQDWASSPKVRAMRTFAERGLYCELLDLQWQEGSLPAEPEACRDALGIGSAREFAAAWPRVEPCFPVGEDGRRRNGKLEEVRVKTLSTIEKRRFAGTVRAATRSLEVAKSLNGNGGSAHAEHVLAHAEHMNGDWRLEIGDRRGEVLSSSEISSPPSPLELSSPSGDERTRWRQAFDTLWKQHPSRRGRKANKAKAMEKWMAVRKPRPPIELVLERHLANCRSAEWQGGYAPDLFRWISAPGWKDEVGPDTTAEPSTSGIKSWLDKKAAEEKHDA